jgi:hypothetical protein
LTIPTLIFAFLIASLIGALYHLVRGGGPGRLFTYLLFSWIGFALGHFVGIWQGWLLFPMGQLDLGITVLGSLFLLFVGDWIGRIRIGPDAISNDENEV